MSSITQPFDHNSLLNTLAVVGTYRDNSKYHFILDKQTGLVSCKELSSWSKAIFKITHFFSNKSILSPTEVLNRFSELKETHFSNLDTQSYVRAINQSEFFNKHDKNRLTLGTPDELSVRVMAYANRIIQNLNTKYNPEVQKSLEEAFGSFKTNYESRKAKITAALESQKTAFLATILWFSNTAQDLTNSFRTAYSNGSCEYKRKGSESKLITHISDFEKKAEKYNVQRDSSVKQAIEAANKAYNAALLDIKAAKEQAEEASRKTPRTSGSTGNIPARCRPDY